MNNKLYLKQIIVLYWKFILIELCKDLNAYLCQTDADDIFNKIYTFYKWVLESLRIISIWVFISYYVLSMFKTLIK